MKIPVISLAILGGQIAAANALGGDLKEKFNRFQGFYTGFSINDGSFNPGQLVIGYAPWLVKRFILPIARPRLGGMHLPVSLS